MSIETMNMARDANYCTPDMAGESSTTYILVRRSELLCLEDSVRRKDIAGALELLKSMLARGRT